MKNFFQTLFKNITTSFKKQNFIWHILAFFATYMLVASGFDWKYFTSMQKELLHMIFWPGIIIGAILPVMIPLTLILIGMKPKKKRSRIIGWALGHAALAGWLISSSYKTLTGRIQPDLINLSTDISGYFQFGFYRHGIFWGWPSSHTTVAFAMSVASLFLLNKKQRLLKYIAMAYAFYIGIAVSFSVHWFSDFVAGAIIGTVVGVVVGKGFAVELEQSKQMSV